ncbi:MAG: hypothetical protein JWQ55_4662, partial [Rhodopila sp.]|nr:hypothetical protein [Rhodopila sp.]
MEAARATMESARGNAAADPSRKVLVRKVLSRKVLSRKGRGSRDACVTEAAEPVGTESHSGMRL